MEQLVRLKGTERYLERLSELFSVSDIFVEKQDDYYLKAQNFNDMKPKELYEFAVEEVDKINHILHYLYGYDSDITTNCIIEVNDEGIKKNHVYMSAHVSCKAEVSVKGVKKIDCEGHEKPEKQISEAQRMLTLLKKNPHAAKALRLYTEKSWYNLYKIFEIIRDDLGKAPIPSSWVTSKNLNRFTQSAQCSELLGDEARHAAKRFKMPEEPMMLDEAVNIIRVMLNEWIKTKE